MWFSRVYLVLLVFYMVFRGLPSFIGFRRQFPRVSGKTGKKSFVELETSSPFSFSFVLPFNVSIDFSLIFFDELARTFHFVCVCVCVCVCLYGISRGFCLKKQIDFPSPLLGGEKVKDLSIFIRNNGSIPIILYRSRSVFFWNLFPPFFSCFAIAPVCFFHSTR